MFANYSLKDLRKLVRDTQEHHNITGSSKMKKHDLVNHLHNHFILHDNKVYLKYGSGGGMSINNRINQLKQEITEDIHYLQSIRDFHDFASLEVDDPNLYHSIINALDEIPFNLTPHLDIETDELENDNRRLQTLVLHVHQYYPHVPVPRVIATNSNNPQVSRDQNIVNRILNLNRRLPEANHFESPLLTEIRNRANTNTVTRAQNSRENSIYSNISDSSEFTDSTQGR
jgi:hypothetical protein